MIRGIIHWTLWRVGSIGNLREEILVNQLASEFGSIDGITTTYEFAKNPDRLTSAQLPAVLFVPSRIDLSPKAHHNIHRNKTDIVGVLYVASRKSRGGKLKFLDNSALPFLYTVRKHFQKKETILRLLDLGLISAELVSGSYGAGGDFLTYDGIEHVGIVFQWEFLEII